MGTQAEIRAISLEIYAKLENGEEVSTEDLETGKAVSLDKAWYDFHNLFKQDLILKYIIAGNHPQFSGDFDEFIKDTGRDFYVGLTSPDIVAQIANVLETLSEADLISRFEQAGLRFDEYYRRYYDEAKQLYLWASENSKALYICIA